MLHYKKNVNFYNLINLKNVYNNNKTKTTAQRLNLLLHQSSSTFFVDLMMV